jgi:membrane protein DedA with SNARE-associated domain
MNVEMIRDTAIGFVQTNRSWAPFLVAGLAFGESVAFISLLTPATFILVGIGVLIGAAGLEFWPIWLGAAVGAGLGDWLSYEIGRRLKTTAYKMWPLSRYPNLAVHGEAFVSRYGSWGLFAGRFIGPARAVIPLIAGIFAMPLVLFLVITFASAFVWSFVLLAPGAGLVNYLSW